MGVAESMRRELRVITTRCRQHTLLTGGGTCTCAWMEVPFNSWTHAVIMKLVFINATIYKNLIVRTYFGYFIIVNRSCGRGRARVACVYVCAAAAGGGRAVCLLYSCKHRASKQASHARYTRSDACSQINIYKPPVLEEAVSMSQGHRYIPVCNSVPWGQRFPSIKYKTLQI